MNERNRLSVADCNTDTIDFDLCSSREPGQVIVCKNQLGLRCHVGNVSNIS